MGRQQVNFLSDIKLSSDFLDNSKSPVISPSYKNFRSYYNELL